MKASKTNLFDDDESESEDISFDIDAKIKTSDKKRKLASLQAKVVTNDARFKIDERFADDDESAQEQAIDTEVSKAECEDGDFAKEKNDQLKILESVLGQDVNIERPRTNKKRCPIIIPRDGHLKELPLDHVSSIEKKKKKKEPTNDDNVKIGKRDSIKNEQTNSEKFFEVADDLKKTFEEKNPFTVSSLFQTQHDAPEQDFNGVAKSNVQKKIKKSPFDTSNPFRYDSSDSDGEEHEIVERKSRKLTDDKQFSTKVEVNNEKFFFDVDDARLNDGLAFIRNVDQLSGEDFTTKRREIKQIARSKVRNCKRKQEKFPKKVAIKRKFNKAKGRKTGKGRKK